MTTPPPHDTQPSRLTRLVAVLKARPRLVTGVLLGCLAYPALDASYESPTRLLIGWDIGVIFYLTMTWTMMARANVHRMRQQAASHDEGEWTIILLSMTATMASLVAIGVELHHAHTAAPATQAWRVGLGALTIFTSWFFVHTIMAQHYAHDYYLREDGGHGLIFPDHIREPDYWDFLYVSFTIGAASQTSDVSVASGRIRRVVLAHTVLSFLFNTTILALGINVGASLL